MKRRRYWQGYAYRKEGEGILPPLPNASSKVRTATTFLIDIHYSNLRVVERWDWERYLRLCRFLKLTEAELASFVCMPHDWLPVYKARNRLPYSVGGGGRAVALLLTVMEARVLRKWADTVQPFPNLRAVKRKDPAGQIAEPVEDQAHG